MNLVLPVRLSVPPFGYLVDQNILMDGEALMLTDKAQCFKARSAGVLSFRSLQIGRDVRASVQVPFGQRARIAIQTRPECRPCHLALLFKVISTGDQAWGNFTFFSYMFV